MGGGSRTGQERAVGARNPPQQVVWGAGVAIGVAAVAGTAGRRQEASSGQGSRLAFLCLPSVTGHKSHEARRKNNEVSRVQPRGSRAAAPGGSWKTRASTPWDLAPAWEAPPFLREEARAAWQPSLGPGLRCGPSPLPAAGGGPAGRALPSGRGAPAEDAGPPHEGCGPRRCPGAGGQPRPRPPLGGHRGSRSAPAAGGAPRPDGARTAHPHREERAAPSPEIPPPVPPRVLKWWAGRPASPFLPPSSPPLRPALPRARPSPPPRPRGAAAPPSVRPGPGSAGIRRQARAYPGNTDPGNTATPLPGIRQRLPPLPSFTCAGLASRGRGQRCPPRRPSAAARPPAALRGAAGVS
ncbi:basic proline-rich protein-like [Manacus candei]|uniref:basic proline-rich protein-like n=1 Tax=Manacus candei TaxID=415023 RepID=UPI002226087E|nr:basic proline-rich protein-like [Manacus candei]